MRSHAVVGKRFLDGAHVRWRKHGVRQHVLGGSFMVKNQRRVFGRLARIALAAFNESLCLQVSVRSSFQMRGCPGQINQQSVCNALGPCGHIYPGDVRQSCSFCGRERWVRLQQVFPVSGKRPLTGWRG